MWYAGAMARGYRYSYRLLVAESTRPALTDLAASLGYINTVPGKFAGAPSPASLLDALASAYEVDPGRVIAGMRLVLSTPSDADQD